MKNTLLIISFVLTTSGLIAQVLDKDGNNYKTVQIGSQVWMSENLNVSHFRNGDIIPEAKDTAAWVMASNIGKPAWCYYNNDTAKGRIYGKLYNWYALNDPRGLAPDGWHIPSTLEYDSLISYLGGINVAGGKMKANWGWDKNGNGNDESGFAGLPGGYRSNFGPFNFIGLYAYWWSSSENSTGNAWFYFVNSNDSNINKFRYDEGSGLSIRCVRN